MGQQQVACVVCGPGIEYRHLMASINLFRLNKLNPIKPMQISQRCVLVYSRHLMHDEVVQKSLEEAWPGDECHVGIAGPRSLSKRCGTDALASTHLI